MFLTAKEQYYTHMRLAKWYNTHSMKYSWWMMCVGHGRKERLTAEEYSYAKEAMVEANKNRVCSDETRKKLSESNTGKVRTPEMRKKYSEAKKSPQKTKTCPHCGKTAMWNKWYD